MWMQTHGRSWEGSCCLSWRHRDLKMKLCSAWPGGRKVLLTPLSWFRGSRSPWEEACGVVSAVSDPDLAHNLCFHCGTNTCGFPECGCTEGGCFQILPFVPNLTLPCPSEGSQAPKDCKFTCRSLKKKKKNYFKTCTRGGQTGPGGVVPSPFLLVFDTGEAVLL